MPELTLDNIQQYLLNAKVSDISGCNAQLIGINTITDIDTFLLKQIEANTRSYTRKGNFLDLYNSQYNKNIEIAIGILFVSAILAKMMFYPINLKN